MEDVFPQTRFQGPSSSSSRGGDVGPGLWVGPAGPDPLILGVGVEPNFCGGFGTKDARRLFFPLGTKGAESFLLGFFPFWPFHGWVWGGSAGRLGWEGVGVAGQM